MSTKKNGKKISAQKRVVKKPTLISKDSRLRRKPVYKSFRLHKRVKHPAGPLPSWRAVTKKSLQLLFANKRSLATFFFVYGLLYLVFVRGLSSPVDVQDIRDTFRAISTDNVSAIASNFTIFTLMVQSTTNASGDVQALYQVMFLILSSLALIWLFRQQQAGHKVTMKMATYRGMYPLIPFLLVLLVIGLQTIPASLGNFLFRTVIDNGLAINAFEQTVWALLFFSLLLLTLYMMSSSLIALFVVTLPEMTPMKALKKARQLVKFRRFSVMRKIAALFLFVMVLFIGTVFPLIFVSATAAQLTFFALTVLVVPLVVAYLFVLYRELL